MDNEASQILGVPPHRGSAQRGSNGGRRVRAEAPGSWRSRAISPIQRTSCLANDACTVRSFERHVLSLIDHRANEAAEYSAWPSINGRAEAARYTSRQFVPIGHCGSGGSGCRRMRRCFLWSGCINFPARSCAGHPSWRWQRRTLFSPCFSQAFFHLLTVGCCTSVCGHASATLRASSNPRHEFLGHERAELAAVIECVILRTLGVAVEFETVRRAVAVDHDGGIALVSERSEV